MVADGAVHGDDSEGCVWLKARVADDFDMDEWKWFVEDDRFTSHKCLLNAFLNILCKQGTISAGTCIIRYTWG
jgi:hypothetical protein